MLLVRNFIDCVGSFGCNWRLLVSSALVLCLHHSLSRRNRLHSQLAEESRVSLCHHWTAAPHRSYSLLGWKPGPRARARKFGMVTALRRNRRSVPVGMETRKAFLTGARPSLIRPQPWFFPLPARWLLCCSSLSDHSGPRDLSLGSRAKRSIGSPICRLARRKPRRTAP